MKKTKVIFIISVLIISVILVGCSSTGPPETFAKCLTEGGIKIFGAYWCPNCITQKKMFGDSWEYVNYIECSLPGGKGQTQYCKQAGIEGYPTWEFEDGTRRSGVIQLEELSSITGCSLIDATAEVAIN